MKHVKSILAELNHRLASLHKEEAKLKAAIQTISSLNGDAPTPHKEPGFYARRVRFVATCHRCEKQFRAKRNPKAYGSGRAFCGHPCTSRLWHSEQKQRANAESRSKHRATTLLAGDPLTASH